MAIQCYLHNRTLNRDPILCRVSSSGESHPPFSGATSGRHSAMNWTLWVNTQKNSENVLSGSSSQTAAKFQTNGCTINLVLSLLSHYGQLVKEHWVFVQGSPKSPSSVAPVVRIMPYNDCWFPIHVCLTTTCHHQGIPSSSPYSHFLTFIHRFLVLSHFCQSVSIAIKTMGAVR